MKKHTILTGVLAMAALCGGSAMAQNFNNGDLIIALGNDNPGNSDSSHKDLLVDLGSISQFQFYTLSSQDQTYTYNLSAALTSAFGSGTVGSSIYWAIMGVNDPTASGYQTSVNQGGPNTVWDSLARSNPSVKTTTPYVSGNNDSQGLAVGDIQTIINLNSPGQASPGLITSLATINGGSASAVNVSLGGFTQTIGTDGNLSGDWSLNLLNNGVGTSDLYQSNPGNSIVNRQIYLGSISLSSAGVLTITTVPEPSTLAMVAGGFLSLFAIRRFKNRNA
jgi:hypothetical protein